MKLALVALAVARFAAAGDLSLNLLPPDTKVVFGVRVSAITGSVLFKDAGTEAKQLGDEWLKLVAVTGFDPLHDIDELLIGSAADNQKAAALVVLHGRFDLARMGAGATRYHGIAMVGAGKGGDSVLALLDASTAVAGEIPAVRAAIDRQGRATPLDGALTARVQALRERFDIWGAGERPEGFVAPTGKREELDSLDRFEFGVRISKGFELGAELHARSPKDAEKLAASMQSLKAMMAMMKGREQAVPNIDVQVRDGTIKISLAISEDDLKKAMAAQRAASAPMSRPAAVVGSESTVGMPDSSSGGTNVFVLPGKK